MVHTYAVTQKEQHIPIDAKQDLLNGSHVSRHTEGAVAVSGDQYGEQTYIKQGNQAGGLNGISTNSKQVAVWIESIGVCSHLEMAMDKEDRKIWELELDDRPRTLQSCESIHTH